MTTTRKESWFVSESELDDEQYKVRRMGLKNSYVVKGCAGSGKTVLAIWRAIEALSRSQDCTVVVYTKALKKFIVDALTYIPEAKQCGQKVLIYEHWRHLGKPKTTHIIVDEVQDFTEEEIQSFIDSASTSVALFGDTAQKLYAEKRIEVSPGVLENRNTVSVEDIASMMSIPIYILKVNHRLPKKVARFAQYLVNNTEPLESQCKKEGARIPLVAVCKTQRDEIDFITNQILSKGLRDVGILVPNNEAAEELFGILLERGIPCEARFSRKGDGAEALMTLNFQTDNPKILTYHSSKGLQFENVFLPFCSKFNSKIKGKAPLYVACTRASQELTITCSNELHLFLQEVPTTLYDRSDLRTVKI